MSPRQLKPGIFTPNNRTVDPVLVINNEGP